MIDKIKIGYKIKFKQIKIGLPNVMAHNTILYNIKFV